MSEHINDAPQPDDGHMFRALTNELDGMPSFPGRTIQDFAMGARDGESLHGPDEVAPWEAIAFGEMMAKHFVGILQENGPMSPDELLEEAALRSGYEPKSVQTGYALSCSLGVFGIDKEQTPPQVVLATDENRHRLW